MRQHIYEEKKDFDRILFIDFSNKNISHMELKWIEHKLIRDFKQSNQLYNVDENVSIKLTEERQKELLFMEMKEEYIEYDMSNTKKGKCS